MSDSDQYEDLPELYDDDVVSPVEEEIHIDKKAKPAAKRKFTNKQLETVKANLEKARQARQKQVKTRKREEDEYDNYAIQAPTIKQVRPTRQRQPEPEYYDESASDDDYEPPPRSRKSKAPTKKELKEEDRISRMENILNNIWNAQKKAKKKPPVHQTIVQIPKQGTKQPSANGVKILKMF